MIEEKESRNHRIVDFLILLLLIYAFFGYSLPKSISYIILAVVAIGLLINILFENRRITYNSGIVIILIIIFVLLSMVLSFYSVFPDTSVKTSINRSTILIIGALLCIESGSHQKTFKYILCFAAVHSFFTIFSYFFPSIFQNYILSILPYDIKVESIYFLHRNLYAGITNQIGRNSFYIALGIAALVSDLTVNSKNNNRAKKIIVVMFAAALLLTGKRGALIATIVSVLLIVAIDAKLSGRSGFIKVMRNIVAITVLIILIILVLPDAVAPFTRFMDRLGGDITSGRIKLYGYAFEMFKEKPLLGWGSGVFSSIYKTGVHNLYIQLLAEQGVIGFTNFMSIMIVNIIVTFRALKSIYKFDKSNSHKYLLFSLYIQSYFVLYGFIGNPINDGFVLIIYLLATAMPYTLKSKEFICVRLQDETCKYIKSNVRVGI